MEIIIILIIFSSLIIWAGFSNSRNSQESANDKSVSDPFNQTESTKFNRFPTWVYKKPIIKSLPIKGTFYDIGEDQSYAGYFLGFVECDYNPYDHYSVAVYNNKNVQLGYVPKKNIWLFHSLNHYHNGRAFAWGNVHYLMTKNRWAGMVQIPVGYSDSAITGFKEIILLNWENDKLYAKPNKALEDFSKILENHDKMTFLAKTHNAPGDLYFIVNKNIFNQYSKQLESIKDWSSLVNLEKYSSVFYQINEKTRMTIWQRINKAKLQIGLEIKEKHVADEKKSLFSSEPKLQEGPSQWETPRAYWSSIELPGYRFSDKKKAWWKQK